MTPDQAEKALHAAISVTPQKVTLAKAILRDLILAQEQTYCDELVKTVVVKNGGTWPLPTMVIHPSVDCQGNVKQIAESLSWRIAGLEALWSLIYSGFAFPQGVSEERAQTVHLTTVVPASGGSGMTTCFRVDTGLPVPHQIHAAPSARYQEGQILSDPHLYVHGFGLVNIHPQIESSLRDAVRCFRAELYTPAIAMLGRASEGAWLEVGKSLLRVVPEQDSKQFSKKREALEDPTLGPMKKAEAVQQMYEHTLFGHLVKGSGVRVPEMRQVAQWSDSVRDSRNTIHFEVEPAVPNTYEKVLGLLVGAVPNIQTLYRVKIYADAHTA